MSGPGLADKVILIDEGLAQAHIPHAFGGAIALAYYGEPRTTVDIDLNVFLAADRFEDVKRVLSEIGVDRFPSATTIRRDGQGRAFWGSSPVDLFFSYDPIHDAMRRDARGVPFGDRSIPILSMEHLIVAKVVYDRPKDWIDIEQVLAANPSLDVKEIDRWLGHVLGAGDARHDRFHGLVNRLLGHDVPEDGR